MSKHLGLIIGVNQYQDSTFRPLQFAENDARALAQWLVNSKGGKWAPPDVQLVQGQYATRELIESLMSQLCIQKAEPGDVVLIYFAGHAFVDEKSGDGYLAVANTQYHNATTCIHLASFVSQIMTRSRAAQILCILDCFQTGQVWSMRRSTPYDSKPLLGPTILNTLQQQANRLCMCSCRGNEQAPESGERGLGMFAHRTILGVCGPASDQITGNILLPNLHAYLFSNLGAQQRPQLFGQQQFPLVLIGELPDTPGSGQFPPLNGVAVTSNAAPKGSQTSGLLKTQESPYATVLQAPVVPAQEHSTTGHMLNSAINQQRQQMLASAQQFFQAQNFGEAFNLVEHILQIAPTDQETLTLKAQILGSAGRFQEALAVVDQMGQMNPNNPMAWSMRAVLLNNTGQHQAALAAIERSLELDAQNPETYAIKNNIMGNVAVAQSQGSIPAQSKFSRKIEEEKHGGIRAFSSGLGLQILGLLIGSAGPFIAILQPHLPTQLSIALISIGFAILCVTATRGAFRHGAISLVSTFLTSLLAGLLLGATYILGYSKIINKLANLPKKEFLATINSLIVPVLFLAIWLAVAALLPFILGLIGWLVGSIIRVHRRRK